MNDMNNELRERLTFTGDIVSGEVSMKEARLISIPAKERYNAVDLCMADTVNIAIAEIHCNWLDYQNKVILGHEIEKRWNDYPAMQSEIEALKAENERLKSVLTKCKAIAGQKNDADGYTMDEALCDIWNAVDDALCIDTQPPAD